MQVQFEATRTPIPPLTAVMKKLLESADTSAPFSLFSVEKVREDGYPTARGIA